MNKRVGKRRFIVTSCLRLLGLAPVVQAGIYDGFISMRRGRAIIPVKNPEQRTGMCKRIIAGGPSICNAKELVRRIQNPETTRVANINLPKNNSKIEVPSYIREHVSTLNHFFGMKVTVKIGKDEKGSLTIPPNSEEGFKRT